jgi:lipoyl(octanoyl) transferase
MNPPIQTLWLSKISYTKALRLQKEQAKQIHEGGSEVLLGLEHPNVITLGKRGGAVHTTDATIPIIQTQRGGLATAHEPGQLVLYPIINIEKRKIGIRRWVHGIEDILLAFLNEHGLIGTRSVHAGIWLNTKKIASIGLQMQNGISTHGLAINISNPLTIFSHIDVCGLPGLSLTSMNKEGVHITTKDAFFSLSHKLKDWIENS